MRRVLALVAAVLTIGSGAAAQDKVSVGVFPLSSSLPYFVALERGFFKEQNIEPEMTNCWAGRPMSPRRGRGRFGRSPRQTPRSALPPTPQVQGFLRSVGLPSTQTIEC